MKAFLFYISSFKVWLVFVTFTILFLWLMHAMVIPQLMSMSGGMKILDMMPTGYNYDYVTGLFQKLGDEGRDLYMNLQLVLDLFYPFFFGMAGCITLVLLFKKIYATHTRAIYLAYLPLVAMVFDYGENFGIHCLLKNYPNITENTVARVNTFTLIKSYSTAAFWLTLIGALLVWGWKSVIMKD